MDRHEQDAKEISELIRLYFLLDHDARIQTFGYMRGLVDEAKLRIGRPLQSRPPKGSDADAEKTIL